MIGIFLTLAGRGRVETEVVSGSEGCAAVPKMLEFMTVGEGDNKNRIW